MLVEHHDPGVAANDGRHNAGLGDERVVRHTEGIELSVLELAWCDFLNLEHQLGLLVDALPRSHAPNPGGRVSPRMSLARATATGKAT